MSLHGPDFIWKGLSHLILPTHTYSMSVGQLGNSLQHNHISQILFQQPLEEENYQFEMSFLKVNGGIAVTKLCIYNVFTVFSYRVHVTLYM